jgi:two-component system chemotaxis sensor kinase CheA
MADSSTENGTGSDIDLTQFYQVFFEEAGENLDRMEQQLLEINIESADDEELNSIFRCAHSVKGGAATFGFNDVAELTHQMESLLDKLRRHELQPSPLMVDVLLQSGDALRALLARHQGFGGGEVDTTELLFNIRALASGEKPILISNAAQPKPVEQHSVSESSSQSSEIFGHGAKRLTARQVELCVGPLDNPEQADNLIELFKEIIDLGTIEPLDGGKAAEGMRRFKITTTTSDNDLLDLCTFHVSREQLKLVPVSRGFGFYEEAPGAPKKDDLNDIGYGFFDEAPGSPGSLPARASGQEAAAQSAEAQSSIVAAEPAKASASKASPKIEKPASTTEASTLRVSVEKVDQLLNLVGELVITQAMLSQNGEGLDPKVHQQMISGLADLMRNTRDLQESVMAIRMIPMSMVFNRFPRMLRDLAAKLGKKVDFVTIGEATELDKGLVEKITDPLTHLVRNSCDHGIEPPAERVAKGKPEQGVITLAASHQGGSIVIEVRDDGRGLSREKLIRKAREKGIDAPDSMTDAEAWNLIFAPGFSTADVVTDVSGRGVGMDVVKKNILSLGGTVDIDSAEGYGMRVNVRLPLTLAIMDGMSVGVGEEVYIVPLSSVVESFQVQPEMIRTIGTSARVVEVRNEYMPVLELERVFGVPRFDFEKVSGIMVVAEAEGGRVALLVDELLGQQQVVVKNLEANYRRVNDISGATIMGDGRVALILDVGSLVRHGRH